MKTDLITRYIYAVTRNLPPDSRADVETELDGLIAELLAGRCDGEPAVDDIRQVLTELGHPDELAAKYRPDDAALISGANYVMYRRILRLVLPVAAVAIALATGLSYALDWPETASAPAVGMWIGQTLGAAVGGAIQAFAVITIVFAILERRKVRVRGGDFLDNLPPVPKATARIKPRGPVINMVWWILLVVLFLGVPQVIGGWTPGAGWVPVFSVSHLRSLWLPVILWAVLGIAKDVVQLVEEQYTPRLAILTVVANILVAGCTAVVFLPPAIINPDFVAHLDDFVTGAGGRVIWPWGEHLNLVVFGIIGIVLVIETAATIIRAIVNRA
ncbi:MAG: hypothetical protein LBI33_02835 [Propionibacteriaceae bacterium]|jgi:hypothetical protein|nr:hypothetical protein [Propionibacteriaceae bacterium]